MTFSAITFHSGVVFHQSGASEWKRAAVRLITEIYTISSEYKSEYMVNKNNDYFTQLLESMASKVWNTYEQAVAYKITVSFS